MLLPPSFCRGGGIFVYGNPWRGNPSPDLETKPPPLLGVGRSAPLGRSSYGLSSGCSPPACFSRHRSANANAASCSRFPQAPPETPRRSRPAHWEAYGRSIARDFAVSLDALQGQGRTLVYLWNPKSRLASCLRDLTGVVYDGLDPQTKEQLFAERRQPRAKDKPVIHG